MLESGDAGQLESWYEYYQLEPWGDEQQVFSTGMARLVNVIKDEANKFSQSKVYKKPNYFKDDFLVMKLRKKKPTRKEKLAAMIENLENMETL